MKKLLVSAAVLASTLGLAAPAYAAHNVVVIKQKNVQTAHSTTGNATNTNSSTINVHNGNATVTSSSSSSSSTSTHSCTVTSTVNGVTTVTNC